MATPANLHHALGHDQILACNVSADSIPQGLGCHQATKSGHNMEDGTGLQDRDGAVDVLAAIRKRFPWLRHIFADGGYPQRRHLVTKVHQAVACLK